jgi:CPA2 family monovalent cation:H+ antiporter-2
VAVATLTTLATPWMVRAGEPLARAVDRKLPPALQTFAALYATGVERLRRPPARRTRRHAGRLAVRVLTDAALLAGALIATALERARLPRRRRARSRPRRGPGGGARRARSRRPCRSARGWCAARAGCRGRSRSAPCRGPGTRGLDRAVAPRRALVAALHLAMLLAAAVPLMAVLQPFAPRVPAVAALAALAAGLGLVVWHTAANLYGHAQAGAEVIALALAQHDRVLGSDDELARAMARVSDVLPGLGAPEPARLGAASPAVGRTLRELDLRGVTGATVLAITRPAGGAVEPRLPTGREVLEAGDVLALAGTREAVDAARALLAGGDDPGGARGRARQRGVSTLSPTMPATIRPMQPSRSAVAGSRKRTTPSTAVPTVPIPVHTA